LHAAAWLARNASAFDVAIDEVNTLPFLSRLFMPNKTMVWMHQLAREVWLSEAPRVVGSIGYWAEAALLSIYRRNPIMTISDSSAQSFRDFGLRGPINVAEISLSAPVAGESEAVRGRIGYVGRLAPSKRVDHIIRALCIVKDVVPEAHLVVVGSGAENETVRLHKLAQALGVGSRIRFCGRISQDERNREMALFDLLAMTSQREGWGLVVSEAARYGVPSVAYPVPGLVDAVQHGQTGIITDVAEPRALADAIVSLIQNPSLRKRLGQGAQKYLLQFDDERFIGRFEEQLSLLSTNGYRP